MSYARVLVVDDSASTCLFIATALQKAGYEVDIALNGQEGIAKFTTFHPQCLILDVLLPGISGYALCRQIRQSPSGKTLPLILISTKNAPLDISYGLRQGANRYLPKPFTAEVLIQTVWEIMPEPFRHIDSSQISLTGQQPALPASLALIPRRTVSQNAMQTSNPFAQVPVRRNGQEHRLYEAIDGKKTVLDLAAVTGLEVEEVINTLKTLLKDHSIQIYTPTGKLMERSL